MPTVIAYPGATGKGSAMSPALQRPSLLGAAAPTWNALVHASVLQLAKVTWPSTASPGFTSPGTPSSRTKRESAPPPLQSKPSRALIVATGVGSSIHSFSGREGPSCTIFHANAYEPGVAGAVTSTG